MGPYATALLLLCAAAVATCSATDSVTISGGPYTPPAWYTAVRAEDAATRAKERAEDAATRAVERAEDKAALGSVKAALGSVNLTLQQVVQALSTQAEDLAQVAQAVVTQTVAGQVEQCAQFTALYTASSPCFPRRMLLWRQQPPPFFSPALTASATTSRASP